MVQMEWLNLLPGQCDDRDTKISNLWCRLDAPGLDRRPALWSLLNLCSGYSTRSALGVCSLLHWVNGGLGSCTTYHRLLTHRSCALVSSWLKYPLVFLTCCTSLGGPVQWVADHGRHHAHADDVQDVHSPRLGLAWAYVLWGQFPTPSLFAALIATSAGHPTSLGTGFLVWINRSHFVFSLLLFVGLFVADGMPWLVWDSLVRSLLLLHATWFVNSATHTWGNRPYASRDTSTNLCRVALIVYVEGSLNKHHALPASARHGFQWWQDETTY